MRLVLFRMWPTRRSTILLIIWSTLAVLLLYLRARHNADRPKMPHRSYSADFINTFFHWPILELVQTGRIYPDGKQFVDMPLKRALDEVIRDFKRRGITRKSAKTEIIKFLQHNYFPAGSDIQQVQPPDWRPEAIEKLAEKLASQPGLANWTRALHLAWRDLARSPKPVILNEWPRLSSLVVPDGADSNWFIVAGGRFRELYYWDSYWIIRGLAVSGMHETMRSILHILLALVTALGYVPNCNRVYCLNRSHPPMLCLMVDAYLNATNDLAFLRENFNLLEREYDWWMSERTSTVLLQYKYSYALNHYDSSATKPRPESYREDLRTRTAASSVDDGKFYAELSAASESGADFSSRWLAAKPDHAGGDLSSIATSRIIPVDLNAIMYKNERLLSAWATQLGFRDKAYLYAESARLRMNGIQNVLWNQTSGCWFDWHLEREAPVSDRFYASNLVPLFTGAVHEPSTTLPRVLDYLEGSGALVYPAGVPFSLVNNSKQQWDFPNVWPPYQHMLVTGLAEQAAADPSGRALRLAKRLAGAWLRGVQTTWKQSGVMHEKADCRTPGQAGSGGEYESQVGFVWTNGVALDFLAHGLL